MSTATLESVSVSSTARIVELTRLIRASRARIFAAWTEPAQLQHWFGPAERICTLAESDPRVGGAFRLGVRLKDKPDAAEAFAHGIYTAVIPNKQLQFTWSPSWSPDEKSLVTVELEHVGGGTEVTLRHEHIPPGSYENYCLGWDGSLTKLAAAVERR